MNPKLDEYVTQPRTRRMQLSNVKYGHKNWFAKEMIQHGKKAKELEDIYGIDIKNLSRWKNRVL